MNNSPQTASFAVTQVGAICLFLAFVTLLCHGSIAQSPIETKMRRAKVTLTAYEPIELSEFVRMIAAKSKCDIVIRQQGVSRTAPNVSATNVEDEVDVLVWRDGGSVLVKPHVRDVSTYDLLRAVVEKSGCEWHFTEAELIIEAPGLKEAPSGTVRPVSHVSCQEEERAVLGKDFTLGSNAFCVIASPWITRLPNGESAIVLTNKGDAAVSYMLTAIYVALCEKTNNADLFNCVSERSPALRVSPRGEYSCPIWDKCGEHIAYVRGREVGIGFDIVVLDVRSGREVRYSDLGSSPVNQCISWDASGRMIAYTGTNGIYILNTVVRTTRLVVETCGMWTSISPDGKYVCLASSRPWHSGEPGSGEMQTRETPEVIEDADVRIQGTNQNHRYVLESVVERNEGCRKGTVRYVRKSQERYPWTLRLINIDSGVEKTIDDVESLKGLVCPIMWMPDSSGFVFGNVLSEKEQWNLSYHLYTLGDDRIVPYTSTTMPLRQSLRYWGSHDAKE